MKLSEKTSAKSKAFVSFVRENAMYFLISAVILLFYADALSPLYEYRVGYDSSFFILAGRSILRGSRPYIDICDVKGPLFFLLQAISQLIIPDKTGVFLMELLSILVSTFFVLRLCSLFRLSRPRKILVYFVFCLIFSVCVWGGDTPEEFLLPFNLACLYYGLRYIRRDGISVRISALFGLSFGFCLLSKLTMAACICSLMITVAICLVKNSDYSELAKAAGYFLLGLAVAVLPVLLWLHMKGCLTEMINWAFGIALRRAGDTEILTMDDSITPFKWEALLSPCYFGIIMSYILYRKGLKDYRVNFMLSCSLITYLVLHLGSRIAYYLFQLTPLALFETILIFQILDGYYIEESSPVSFRKKLNLTLITLTAGTLVLFSFFPNLKEETLESLKCTVSRAPYENYIRSTNLMAKVPSNERDNIFSSNTSIIVFGLTGVIPANEAPYNTAYMMDLNGELDKKIHEDIANGKYSYLVIDTFYGEEDFLDYASRYYEPVYSDANIALYGRKI